MFKLSDEDDDSFFTPSSSSNLASLFGTNMVLGESQNVNLTYTAPKQPQVNDEKKKEPSVKNSLIIAKAVHTFKLINGEYISQGKLGCAIVGNATISSYQLILYKDKINHILNVKIISQFEFTIQEKNYVSFNDNLKQNWCILFNDDKDKIEFLHELELIGAKLVTLKPQIETAKPDKPKEVINSSSNSEESSKPTDDVKPIREESTLSDTNDKKAGILSRMAKMGRPILLPKVSNSSDISDSDSEREKKILRKHNKRLNLTTNPVNPQIAAPISGVQTPLQQYTCVEGQYVPLVPLPQQMPTQQLLPLMQQIQTWQNMNSGDNLNVFLSENRTHNSEIRMRMLRFDDKLDKILEKIETSSSRVVNNGTISDTIKEYEDKIRNLEEKLNGYSSVLHSKQESEMKIATLEEKLLRFEEVLKENDKNQCALSDALVKLTIYEQEITSLRSTVEDLRTTNENLKESDCLELEKALKRISEYENQITNLEIQLKKCVSDDEILKTKIKEYENSIDYLEIKLEECNIENIELQKSKRAIEESLVKPNEYENRISELEVKLAHSSKENENTKIMEHSNDEYERKINEYVNKIADLQKKISESDNEKSIIRSQSIENLEPQIKLIMNNLYGHMKEFISDDDNKTQITSAIVDATYAILAKVKEH